MCAGGAIVWVLRRAVAIVGWGGRWGRERAGVIIICGVSHLRVVATSAHVSSRESILSSAQIGRWGEAHLQELAGETTEAAQWNSAVQALLIARAHVAAGTPQARAGRCSPRVQVTRFRKKREERKNRVESDNERRSEVIRGACETLEAKHP